MADVIGPGINQPLKPERRAFIKAMGAITGAALLPSAAASGPLFAPMPASLPLPIIEPAMTPLIGVRGIAVYVNGLLMQENFDYVQTGKGAINFFTAPLPSDVVNLRYQHHPSRK